MRPEGVCYPLHSRAAAQTELGQFTLGNRLPASRIGRLALATLSSDGDSNPQGRAALAFDTGLRGTYYYSIVSLRRGQHLRHARASPW
jgi:hypothetical protein